MLGFDSASVLGLLVPRGGGEDIPLLKVKLLVGRRDNCDICLRFTNISSKHSELELVDGYWQVRDLGSANGTKVNGERVEAKWLMPGDEVGFAKHYYTIQYTAVGPVPAPLGEVSTVQSLLEKAGLVNSEFPRPPQRPARTESRPAAETPKPPPGPPARPTDEDAAFDWLNG